MITIDLNLPTDSSGIAGYDFGKQVYLEQVKPRFVNKNEEITINFPEYIERVASSFVQGFFSILIEEISYEDLKTRVKINMKNEKLEKIFWDRLY